MRQLEHILSNREILKKRGILKPDINNTVQVKYFSQYCSDISVFPCGISTCKWVIIDVALCFEDVRYIFDTFMRLVILFF